MRGAPSRADPERRRHVEELCDAAHDRDARDRAAFIAAACGADEAPRHEWKRRWRTRRQRGFLVTPMGEVASAQAGWGRSIASAIRSRAATWRSKCCHHLSRTIPIGSRDLRVRRHCEGYWVVRNNYIHHNHKGCIGSYSSHSILDSNEIAYNGWDQKIGESAHVTFRNCFVHDNDGARIWHDSSNRAD